MLQIAIVAGGICAVIVAAYFIAIDQYRAATASGGLVAGAPRQAFVKQLEAALRPVSHLPAGAAIQLRQKLSQAGNPAALTPAGFQAVRYSLAAMMAIAALENMADMVGVPDLHHLVESIVQSDQMGVPIARLLRVQATEMRRRQRQGAQERAAQASSRMVFPMVGCIFPVLWIVLLGPAIIQVLKSLK